jgi:isoleucyl-tRNA synthetase
MLGISFWPRRNRAAAGRGSEGVCRAAYEAFEFHKVFHAINGFCSVDLSSLYVDITKDRLYCEAPDSPRRRATQAAMRTVFDALARLSAPILAFTADEAWEFSGKPESIHLESFPEIDPALASPEALGEVAALLELRGAITHAVEEARKEKLIGNALEADVVLRVADPAMAERLAARIPELEEFFILSSLRVEHGPETVATLTKTAAARCDRCWRHRPDVGSRADHPALCGRCADAVGAGAAR